MRQVLGVVPESTGLYSRLTAWENIRYHSRMHGVSDEDAWARTAKFAQHLDMMDSLGRHTKGFSRGMRQKTALLRALAHGPSILLLDEPTAGLDITSARTVRRLVEPTETGGGYSHLLNPSTFRGATSVRPDCHCPQWRHSSRWFARASAGANSDDIIGGSLCCADKRCGATKARRR